MKAATSEAARRELKVTESFSLSQTCASTYWGRGRWPSTDWIDGSLIWVGREDKRTVWRRVVHDSARSYLVIEGAADPVQDARWAREVLALGQALPSFDDPVIASVATLLPGLKPYSSGSLFDGLVDSIVGQSISVAAAATVGSRLAALFHPGITIGGRTFWPSPRPEDLAEAEVAAVRATGVTWKRSEALILAAHAALDGRLPSDDSARAQPDEARAALAELPLVGPWTVESTLLWGLGVPDAFPKGDVALLRAVRLAYGRSDISMKEMEQLSRGWTGARGWAARLLWTNLLGVAPDRS